MIDVIISSYQSQTSVDPLDDTWWRLEGEYPARPKQVDGQLGRDLAGQEEPEAGVRLDRVQLLLQRGQPRGREVHVLQEDPSVREDC